MSSSNSTNTIIIYKLFTSGLVKSEKYCPLDSKRAKNLTLLSVHETLYRQDMDAFTIMTDGIVDQILSSSVAKLEVSKEILRRVKARDVYQNAGDALVPPSAKLRSPDEIGEKLSKEIKGVRAEDLVVKVVVMNYGLKDKNPMDSVRFYSKETPDVASVIAEDEVFWVLPKRFQDRYVRLYCKNEDHVGKAGERFKEWCKKKSLPKARQMLK